MKATEGETYIPKTFDDFYFEAKKSDSIIGAYHFFMFNKSGKNQAFNFLTAIK